MSNEFVMVPREWVEDAVKAGAGKVMALSDIATLAECLSNERHGEPVAWVYMRNGEVNYDADIVISNTEGDTLGDGDIWVPVFKEFDAIKSEYFERAYELSMESHKNIRTELDELRAQLYETQRISQEKELRANRYSQQLAKQDALLARTMPYLSNTPDLVQRGAEDLAEEIRITSAGKPCYGPNEWGTECGKCSKCSKCKHSSAEPSALKDWCSTMERPKSQCGCPDCGSSIVQIGEPSAPVEIDERVSGCCCPPKGYSGIWAAAMCPVHQGFRRRERKP